MCDFRVDIEVPHVSSAVFDQVCLVEAWKCPAFSYASMQWYKGHKATETFSCLRSKSNLTEDSQRKNGEQFVVSILTEKSQKLHCHKLSTSTTYQCHFPVLKTFKNHVGSISSLSEKYSNTALQKSHIYFTRPVYNVS